MKLSISLFFTLATLVATNAAPVNGGNTCWLEGNRRVCARDLETLISRNGGGGGYAHCNEEEYSPECARKRDALPVSGGGGGPIRCNEEESAPECLRRRAAEPEALNAGQGCFYEDNKRVCYRDLSERSPKGNDGDSGGSPVCNDEHYDPACARKRDAEPVNGGETCFQEGNHRVCGRGLA